MQNIISQLTALLKKRKLDRWKLELVTAKRVNLYLTKNLDNEAVLCSDRINIEITIYKDYGKEMGESSFSLVYSSGDIDESEINKKIDEALVMCEYSKNKKYSLQETQGSQPKLNLVDKNIASGDVQSILFKLSHSFKQELSKFKDIKPNNLELNATHSKSFFVNSFGVNFSEEKTALYVELTLTATGQSSSNKLEQEYVAMHEFSSIDKLDVAAFVNENVSLVKDVLKSKPLKTFKGNVMISGDALSDFFAPLMVLNPLVLHASARIKHMGMSRYKLGEKIGDMRCDSISIALNPLLPMNPASSSFDSDGVVSRHITLVEKGKFKQMFASKQYADYLGVEPTGAFGSIEINLGKSSKEDLYKMTPLIEIVTFSSFSPNSVSGDFSAEIRLGYKVETDKEGKTARKPFKGGLFVGNVFKLIEFMYLSDNQKEVGGYKGPDAMLFKDAVVSGLE